MTTKNSDQYVKIEMSSLLVQTYLNFENSFSVVHFTPDQTGVLFMWVSTYIDKPLFTHFGQFFKTLI